MDLSLVIPVYNEEENLSALMDEITAALEGEGLEYEAIFIDDGSSDGSYDLLQSMREADDHIGIIRFRRNYGQTAAFAAGFDHARGQYVITMDADRQNDPADIPKLIRRIEQGDCDVVNGWRENRQDPLLMRKVPSKIANGLIATTTGDPNDRTHRASGRPAVLPSGMSGVRRTCTSARSAETRGGDSPSGRFTFPRIRPPKSGFTRRFPWN